MASVCRNAHHNAGGFRAKSNLSSLPAPPGRNAHHNAGGFRVPFSPTATEDRDEVAMLTIMQEGLEINCERYSYIHEVSQCSP